MEITIDPKYGDGLVAANERTIKEVGLEYKGVRVILDVRLGDNVLACNKRTYDSLQDSSVGLAKVPRGEDYSEPDVSVTPPKKAFVGASRSVLEALNKKEQVELLLELGMSKPDIKKLKYEWQRIDAILDLMG